jgi:hypothetical protein
MAESRNQFERGFLAKLGNTRKPKREKNIVVRLTDAEYDMLQRECDKHDVSVSAYVRTALRLVLPDVK